MTTQTRLIRWLIDVCLWQYELYQLMEEECYHARKGVESARQAMVYVEKILELQKRPRPIEPGSLTKFEN